MIKSILYKSVKKDVMSDRPIGCLLNLGGMRSSIICALVNEINNNEINNNENKINTFSIGLENSPDIIFAKK